MKVLFASRCYPPIVGGIENQNYALAKNLAKYLDVRVIANRHGKKLLPLYMVFAMVSVPLLMIRRDTLVLGDGVMAIVGWVVKKIYGRRKCVVCILHGLDLTYPLELYQRWWVRHFMARLDRLIAVGKETVRAGVQRGIPESMFHRISNGVDVEAFSPKDIPRSKLQELLGSSIEGKQVLLTCGRLVKRKGIDWFIMNVMPLLPAAAIYVVSGTGPHREPIERAVQAAGLEDRVYLLGYVSDHEREILFNTGDIFVQPNVPVAGDMEGFGLVVLEAASSGLPVIASRLEGLQEALQHQQNGLLVEPENPQAFRDAIVSLLADSESRTALGRQARRYTRRHFDWKTVAVRYVEYLNQLQALG